MTFNICEYVEFNEQGRGICPSCTLKNPNKRPKLNLSRQPNGAYKCFASCTTAEIRAAVGQPKTSGIIPSALARPTKPVTVSAATIAENHQRLISSPSGPANQWLQQRGFSPDMISHYQIGITEKRFKTGDGETKGFWCLSLPFPAGRDSYYQKLRVSPWTTHDVMPWHQKGIPAQVVIYHQPAAPLQTWLCEGEWDAMMLGWEVSQSELSDAIQVACFTCGAGNVPADDELSKLTGDVVIWYDLDEPGHKGALKAAARLGDRARIATVPHPESSKTGWDVSDALTHGYYLEEFLEAENAAIQPKPDLPHNRINKQMSTNAELMHRAPDFIDFLIPDILTYELYILVAPPRGGKSLMIMNLAHAIAAGHKFMDRPVTQGSVLIVNLEDSEAKVKVRALSMGWDNHIPVYWLDKFKLDDFDELMEAIDGIEDLRLIVIDTLSRAKSSKISESSAEMSQLLEPLQQAAKEREICIMLTHHTGKLNADNAPSIDVFDQIRGSSAIRAVCRGAWLIAQGQQSYRLCTENGYVKEDLEIRLDYENLTWKLIGRWAPGVSDTQKQHVLECLTKLQSATVLEIAAATGINAKSVATVLGRLQADDMVTKQGGVKGNPALYSRASTILQQPTEARGEYLSAAARDVGDTPTNNNISFLSNESSLLTNPQISTDAPSTRLHVEKGGNTDGTREIFSTHSPRNPNNYERWEEIHYRDKSTWEFGRYIRLSPDSLYSSSTRSLENSHWIQNRMGEQIRVADPDLRKVSDET